MGFFDSFCSCMSDEDYDSADQSCSDLADQYDGADQSAEVYGDCMADACFEADFDCKDE
jgi:hypothetical protein